MKFTTKDICKLALGIALYMVLSMTCKIPLIGHIKTDFGYVAFGTYCVTFGSVGTIIGVIGCIFSSMLFSGMFPVGWVFGQIAIGIITGKISTFYIDKLYKSNPDKATFRLCFILIAIWVAIAIFIGIIIIKTVIECIIFSIPIPVKLVKNTIAAIADYPPMLIGVYIGYRVKTSYLRG